VLTADRLLFQHRTAGVFSVRVEPDRVDGRVLRTDPAAAASAVLAWLRTAGTTRHATLMCTIGPLTVQATIAPAEQADLDYEL
jgi:hypothetical protein